MSAPRTVTPYERTQLQRYSKSEHDLESAGNAPVEYVTGVVEFADTTFLVSPDTLIPRIETEGLVQKAVAEIMSRSSAWNSSYPVLIADVGTGCGAVAIATSRALSTAQIPHQVFASDISAQAVAVAQENGTRLLPKKQLETAQFFTSDLLGSYPPNLQFHCMIANLPYIPSERIPTLDESVKDYEPHLALDGGVDGLEIIMQFLAQAKDFVHPTGFVLLEVDYTHDAAAFSSVTDFWRVETYIDDFLRQRFVLLMLR